MSDQISKSKKIKLLAKQKNKCFYCLAKIDIVCGEYDHVNPKNKTYCTENNYRETKSTGVMACQMCNHSKWNYPPSVWRYRIKSHIDELNAEIKRNKRILRSLNDLIIPKK